MNKETQKTFINNDYKSYDDEIDLKALLNSIFRRKNIVILFTTVASIINIIYTANIKPIYKGDFEIHVKKEREQNINNSINVNSNLRNLITQKGTDFKTQEYILKSPFVLKAIYDSLKENYKDKKEIVFEKWVKKYLEVKFIKDTNILRVAYRDSDKEFIKFALNQIAEKYKEYSIQDKEENLIRTIEYLEEQKKIYTIKSKNSTKIFNQFSIDNGLGDIDGFLLNNYKNKKNLLDSNQSSSSEALESNINAGFRFNKQFALLEKYESEFTDYSSKLKPNSKYLSNLKVRIDNLKSLLKRPNEILIKYRELQKDSIRDQFLLDDIENRLIFLELEKAKQPRPWQRISEPIVDDLKIFPNRSSSLIKTLILALITSSVLAIFIDKRSGLIYEINEFKNKLNIINIGEIYMNQKIINSKLIETIFEEKLKENNDQVLKEFCIVKTFQEKIYLNNKIKEIDLEDLKIKDVLGNYSKALFIIKPGTFNSNDIKFINQFSSIYKDKILGWLFAN